MKLGSIVRKMRLQSNSVVIVKAGSELAQTKTLQTIADSLGKTNINNVIILVADNMDDLKVLNPNEMAKHGWFRVDALRKSVHIPVEPETGQKQDEPAAIQP